MATLAAEKTVREEVEKTLAASEVNLASEAGREQTARIIERAVSAYQAHALSGQNGGEFTDHDRAELTRTLRDDFIGLGSIAERMLNDANAQEWMINAPKRVFKDDGERIERVTDVVFRDNRQVLTLIERLLEQAEGRRLDRPALRGTVEGNIPESVRAWSERVRVSYADALRQAGKSETVVRLFGKKALFAFAVSWCPLVLYAAAAGRLPSAVVLLVLAALGFFLPDLALRMEIKQRREALLLDLPDSLAVMALSLGAGQSLRQALELAAQDCQGPFGEELTRALSLARRDKTLGEREAMVVVARENGEPGFIRFAELLAAKESPYLGFLRTQAKALRADQDRYLERTADSAYRRMQLWIAPLAGVMLLILAYGFLHVLAHST